MTQLRQECQTLKDLLREVLPFVEHLSRCRLYGYWIGGVAPTCSCGHAVIAKKIKDGVGAWFPDHPSNE